MSKKSGDDGLRTFNVKIKLPSKDLIEFNQKVKTGKLNRTSLFNQFVADILEETVFLDSEVIIYSKRENNTLKGKKNSDGS